MTVCAALQGLVPGSRDQHAWVPAEQATLCGIAVTKPPDHLRRFPPTNGWSCLSCLTTAWDRFGRL